MNHLKQLVKILVRQIRYLSLLLVLGAMGSGLVLAEQTGEKDEAQKAYTLNTIVVTAGKRQESIQELDASVSLLTAEEIETERIESVDDLKGYLPNVNVQSAAGSTNSFLSIRGVMGQTVPMSTPGVCIYLDDVSLLDPLSNLFSSAYFFDLERIEVLRGPQGSLYGRNAEAGVLLIRTKDPEYNYSAKLLGEYGNYGRLVGQAVLNAPLIDDTLALRLSTSSLNRDGYHDNVILGNTAADADEFSIRAKLLWDITADTSALLAIEDNKVRDGAQDIFPLDIAGPDWDSSRVATNVDGHEHRDMTAYSLRLNHRFDFAELVSITAYRDGRENTFGDPDYWSYDTGYADFTLQQKQFTQEVRLISDDRATTPWKWIIGAFYLHNDMEFNSFYHMGPEGLAMEMDIYGLGEGTSQGAAVFGDVEYLFSNGFRLGAGLRGQYNKDEMDSLRYYEVYGMQLEYQKDDLSSDYTDLMGKVKLAYDFASDLTVYGLVSQGSRPGGITSLVQTTTMQDYAPEQAVNYEVGLKYNLPNDRGFFDLSLFYLAIDDLQINSTGIGGLQYISNAGKARNIGGEASLRLNLLPGLRADLNLGYVDAELEDYTDSGGNYSGNTVPKVPDFTGMASLQYRVEVLPGKSLVARAAYHHVGKTYWDLGNRHAQDSYGLVNATLGLEADWWQLYLWGKNLLDEEYIRAGLMWGDMVVGGYGEPLTCGITLQLEF
ncbi:MAG: hypothetical protein CSA34_05920 [Desulfobulbus propionicus]|nr:MAG: hypothetical protein CSA34_05920 [Desulfobulbus propionicus]